MTPNPSNPMPAPVPQKKGGVSAVVIIAVVVALACPCVGILAAIAIPNFVKFQSRSKQSEAKANLKGAFTAQKAFFAGERKYSEDIGEVGFSPGPGNRYLYAFSVDGELAKAGEAGTGKTGVEADGARHAGTNNDALEKGVPQTLWDESGLKGTCPDDCSITIVAAGNIDNDDTVDVWTVSTKDRTIDGMSVPAGMPHNHIDDTRE
ncbi:MAG: pilin [Myxococcales bacterium]|nr:pilin [Myxococcales bacterium]